MAVCLGNCTRNSYPSYSAEVTALERGAAPGTIAVRSAGYGNNQTEAVRNAGFNAFSILLFKGLPGTALNLPLVDNEREARVKNESYFKKLFDEGLYKNFVVSSTESSLLLKEQGTKKLTVDMVINYTSLRRDLEQNNVIRKLGY